MKTTNLADLAGNHEEHLVIFPSGNRYALRDPKAMTFREYGQLQQSLDADAITSVHRICELVFHDAVSDEDVDSLTISMLGAIMESFMGEVMAGNR